MIAKRTRELRVQFGWTFFGGGAFDLRLPILFSKTYDSPRRECSFGKSALVVLRFVALKVVVFEVVGRVRQSVRKVFSTSKLLFFWAVLQKSEFSEIFHFLLFHSCPSFFHLLPLDILQILLHKQCRLCEKLTLSLTLYFEHTHTHRHTHYSDRKYPKKLSSSSSSSIVVVEIAREASLSFARRDIEEEASDEHHQNDRFRRRRHEYLREQTTAPLASSTASFFGRSGRRC